MVAHVDCVKRIHIIFDFYNDSILRLRFLVFQTMSKLRVS